ncbi:alpha-hydroxy-acid oxidizing protein, partial [Ralstonia sp. 1B3]|uniref:alpha-hydroxy-acid oxidizing protein n=1 Tax=Ralstonia sp. 1B3 TaxID=2997421 RepID=UPI002FCAA243
MDVGDMPALCSARCGLRPQKQEAVMTERRGRVRSHQAVAHSSMGALEREEFAANEVNIFGHRGLPPCRAAVSARMVFDYIEGGADDESGLKHNRAAFESLRFSPSRLTDVRTRDLSTTLAGQRMELPLIVAPMGLTGACRPDGDITGARRARAGIPFVLSTASNVSLEDLARRASGRRWFQLYVVHPEHARALSARALAADYEALVLTTDVTVNGNRIRDLRNGFSVPMRLNPRMALDVLTHPAWLTRQVVGGFPTLPNVQTEGSANLEFQAALLQRRMDAGFSWDDLAALRER